MITTIKLRNVLGRRTQQFLVTDSESDAQKILNRKMDLLTYNFQLTRGIQMEWIDL